MKKIIIPILILVILTIVVISNPATQDRPVTVNVTEHNVELLINYTESEFLQDVAFRTNAMNGSTNFDNYGGGAPSWDRWIAANISGKGNELTGFGYYDTKIGSSNECLQQGYKHIATEYISGTTSDPTYILYQSSWWDSSQSKNIPVAYPCSNDGDGTSTLYRYASCGEGKPTGMESCDHLQNSSTPANGYHENDLEEWDTSDTAKNTSSSIYLTLPRLSTINYAYLDLYTSPTRYNYSEIFFVNSTTLSGQGACIWVEGDIAYVCARDSSAAFVTFNISNSSSPVQLDSEVGSGMVGATGIHVLNEIAYIAVGSTTDSLVTFNVTDPTNVIWVGNITGALAPNWLNGAHDVFVKDEIAYVAASDTHSIIAINVTNTSDLTFRSRINGSGSPNYLDDVEEIHIIGDILYAVSADDDALSTFNISNSSNMTHIDTITGQGAGKYLNAVKDVYVVDNIAYTAAYLDSAIATFNVTDPANIVFLDAITGAGSPYWLQGAQGIWVTDETAFVVSGSGLDQSLVTINVTNPDDIIYMGNISGAGSPNYLGGATDVFVLNNMAYVAVASPDNSLSIFNFSVLPPNIILKVNNTVIFDGEVSKITNTTGDFSQELNTNLTGCPEDSNGNCEVILEVSTGFGEVNLKNLNISYGWNITTLTKWNFDWRNRTNIIVNTTYNAAKNIFFNTTFKLANALLLDAWWVNQNSTLSEWDDETQTITADKLINVTDISFTQGQDPSTESNHTLWTNDMLNETMALQAQSDIKSNGSHSWKNITINWSNPDGSTYPADKITNTTFITTIDDSKIFYNETIYVYVSGTKYDITPSVCQADCDSATPTLEEKTAATETYYVCMEDVNLDQYGTCEYFKVIINKNKE